MAAERDQVDAQVNEILAAIETDESGPVRRRAALIDRQKSRLVELEPQIVQLGRVGGAEGVVADVHGRARPRGASGRFTLDDHRLATARPPGRRCEPLHRTAGQFIVDYLRARGGMRDMTGRESQPDPIAIERMGPWLQRAMENQTTADTPGLLPEPIIGPVLAEKTLVQPFVSSIGGAKPMGGIPGKTFSRPKITQHTLVGLQTAEKTELPSRRMVIGGVPFTKVTKGGVVDISRQDIDWTVPSAWDILLRDLAGVRRGGRGGGRRRDAAPGLPGSQRLSSPRTRSRRGRRRCTRRPPGCNASTTPRRLPNRLWMALDVWAQAARSSIVALIKAVAQMGADGQPGRGRVRPGNMFALPRYVVPSFPPALHRRGRRPYECTRRSSGVLSAGRAGAVGVQGRLRRLRRVQRRRAR